MEDTNPKSKSKVHLVLDLDHTLMTDINIGDALLIALSEEEHAIAEVMSVDLQIKRLAIAGVVPDAVSDNTLIFMRPGLDAFISNALNRFAGVAIWSKAGADWLELALETTPLSNYRHRFSFIWDGSRCTELRSRIEGGGIYTEQLGYTKSLHKVWRAARLRQQGWLRNTTVILDDDPDGDNFVRNYSNGIKMPPFDAEEHIKNLVAYSVGDGVIHIDSWLPAVTQYFTREVLDWDDVRPPEKRWWHLRYL